MAESRPHLRTLGEHGMRAPLGEERSVVFSGAIQLLCLMLVGLCGCGESADPSTRGVVPLTLDVDGQGGSSLQTLPLDLDERLDLHLASGAQHLVDLTLVSGNQYTVELHFEGARPSLRDGALEDGAGTEVSAELERTVPLPGKPEPGVQHGVLRPTSKHWQLEIMAGSGEAQLKHLKIRRWGSSGRLTKNEAVGWQAVGVYGDYRVATALKPSGVLYWSTEVPEGATALAFEVASYPSGGKQSAPSVNAELLVSVSPAESRELGAQSSVRFPISAQVAAWQPVRLELESFRNLEPGQPVRVSVRVARVEGQASPGQLAVSAPVWLCTTGPRRPNLILISLDTTRPDHLGMYGYSRDTSPNLDELADRSVVFEGAQSTAPYTLPAHATMFSGQYPTTHGAEHPAHALDTDRTPLLAALLSEAGYATRAFTGGGYLDGDFGFSHGFSAYSNSDPVIPIEGRKVRDVEASEAGRRYVAARVAQHWSAALEWIERTQDVPFFLFLQTFAIHDYRPENEHRELFNGPARGEGVRPLRKASDQIEDPYSSQEIGQLVDLYDGAIHEVDELVGELLDTLNRLGLADNTIVVVTADHGEDFADHQVMGKPFVGHGQGLWQTLLHVPLVMHVPWIQPRRVGERVSTVDLAPTMLDLLGVSVPDAMQGQSLRALMESGVGNVSPVVSELHSHRGSMRSLVVDDLKVVIGNPDARVSWPVPVPVQLFDLAGDPLELQVVGGEQQATAEGLSASLRALGESLEAERSTGQREAGLSEETRRRLEELGYVDG
ncbi:MAG: sulfatase [Planctomycetota bacterium]|nr:sulfatase [Planctomycetota bacterium]